MEIWGGWVVKKIGRYFQKKLMIMSGPLHRLVLLYVVTHVKTRQTRLMSVKSDAELCYYGTSV